MENDLMHGSNLTPADNVLGWFATEKFDGHRALWDGKKLLTRQGINYNAPAFFTKPLPKHVRLDCELWAGRGNRDELNGADHWRDKSQCNGLRLIVFDSPDINGDYKTRLNSLRLANFTNANICLISPICRIRKVSQLRHELRRIKAADGEGLMLHHPTAEYTAGRTRTLLKLKTTAQLS